MSTAFFQQVDATVHSLIQKAQAKLGITLSHSAVPPVVHGALLRYRFNSEQSLEKVLEALNTLADDSDEIIVSFIESRSLYLKMGFDAFNAVRIDGARNSPLWNMLNAPPIASENRPQWISISPFSGSTPLKSVTPVLRQVQLLANHFQASLRLNPTDLMRAVHLIEPVVSSWNLEDPVTLLLPPTLQLGTSSLLSRYLHLTLRHIVDQGYGSRLEEASKSMIKLQALGDAYEISTVDRVCFGTYVVAFHHTSSKFQINARLLCPSFFIAPTEENLPCNPHVHVVEYSLASLKGVMLVSFSHAPDKNDVDTVQRSLHALLRLPKAGEWTTTLPWHYNSRSQGNLFRLDGMVNFVVMKETITGSLKSARSIRSRSSFTNEVLGPKLSTAENRRARIIVIWIRQSRHQQSSNIGRQLWFILSQLPKSLVPLQCNDTIAIAVEFCSSLQHPWNDRCMASTVLKFVKQSAKESYILTGWADRLSRRVEELPLILADLSRVSSTWLFRGVNENDKDASWLNGAEQLDHLKRALSSNIGTEKQTHFYSRLLDMATRIIDAGSTNHTVRCLNEAMTATLRTWQIGTIIIYSRVSPGKGKTAGCTTISLERQITLLKLFCPLSIKVLVVREDCSSAYADTDRLLVSALTAQTERCCVVAVSLDRVLRRIDALPRLRSIFAATGHIGVCFLWDCDTTVPLARGLGLTVCYDISYQSLENALWDSRRAQPSRGCLPIIQPVVWTVDPSSQTQNYCEEHIHRHAENAELHCMPYTTIPASEKIFKAPEKLMQVDAILLRTESRDWTMQRQQRWAEFVNSYFSLGPNQLIFLQNGKKEWLCHCDLDNLCDKAKCLCDCRFCKLSRKCSCKKKGECVCPEICNCSCDNCHNQLPTRPKSDTGGLPELPASEINHKAEAEACSIDKRPYTSPTLSKPFDQPQFDTGGLRKLSKPSTSPMLSQLPIQPEFGTGGLRELSKPSTLPMLSQLPTQTQFDTGGLREISWPSTSPTLSQLPNHPESDNGGLPELSASEVNQKANAKTYSIDTRKCTVEGCKKPSTQRSWKRYLCSEHNRKRKLDELLLVNCLNRLCLKKRSSHIPYCSLRCYEESVNDPQLCEIEDCLVPCPPDLKATRCMRHHQHAQNNAYVISNVGKAKDQLEAEYYGIFEE